MKKSLAQQSYKTQDLAPLIMLGGQPSSLLVFFDPGPTPVMLGFDETNPRPIQCGYCDCHHRHHGIGRKP